MHGSARYEFISPSGIKDTIEAADDVFYIYVDRFPELAEIFKRSTNKYYHNCRDLPKLPEGKVFYLDYKEPVIKDNFRLDDYNAPFYFADVNFDGEKDLLIQTSITFYNCKILTNGEINHELSDAIDIDLNADTRIDGKNREIITYDGIYNDFCETSYEFYKFNNKGEIYCSKAQENNLRNKERYPTDTTRITTFQYQWKNGVWTNTGKSEKMVRNRK